MNLEWPSVLENERVKLTPLQSSDLEYLLPICIKHPDLLRYSPSLFGTKEALAAYFDKALNTKNRKAFLIFDKVANAYAGTTSYMNIEPYHSRVEIGSTWIAKEYQRTGLNRNMKLLMISYAFEVLNMERVELKTDARNVQSRTAILGIGAKYEGLLRSHTLMTDGYRRDTVYYSILKTEWPEVKSKLAQSIS